jgi:hypothetical protein
VGSVLPSYAGFVGGYNVAYTGSLSVPSVSDSGWEMILSGNGRGPTEDLRVL